MSIYIDWGHSFPEVKAPRAHLFGMLTAGVENVTMNFEQELIEFNGIGYPFAMLGLDASKAAAYNVTYTIKGTYEEAAGKFSEVYGNVVLVDCGYVLPQFLEKLYAELDVLKPILTPDQYDELRKLLDYIN